MKITKDMLVQSVVWPVAAKAKISLYTEEGEVVGVWPLVQPVLGSELSRLIPAGIEVQGDAITVSALNGKMMFETVAPFDTEVRTERPVVGIEERMARLETRVLGAERRERQAQARLKIELKKKEQSDVQVIDEDDQAGAGEPAPSGNDQERAADEQTPVAEGTGSDA